jgi:putative Ca2+/H+ antiporter (TMEM165/GDT1 family)
MARAASRPGKTIDHTASGLGRGCGVVFAFRPLDFSFMEAFLVSAGVVALGEMGDKTQIATVALAARYTDVVQVVLGTTVGMMLANVPAVFLGDKIAQKVSMGLVHGVAAAIFGVLGLLTLFNVGNLL